jgi:hypothetical protein
MKNNFSKISFLLFFLITITLTGCESIITGEGPVMDIKKNVDNFSKFDLQIDAEVNITQGATNNVVITAQNNIAEAIHAVVSSGKLKIYTDKNLVTAEPIIINVMMSSVEEIEISGSGIIRSKGVINAPELDLEVSGSGKIFFHTVSNKIETDISGSGEVHLKGSSIDSELNISGSGKLEAFDFATQTSKIDISGSGNADVTVSQNLTANISGSGNVNYKGNPAKVKSDVNGSGTIHVAE